MGVIALVYVSVFLLVFTLHMVSRAYGWEELNLALGGGGSSEDVMLREFLLTALLIFLFLIPYLVTLSIALPIIGISYIVSKLIRSDVTGIRVLKGARTRRQERIASHRGWE